MKIRLKFILLLFLSLIYSQDCCEAEEIATNDCGGMMGCYIPQCTQDCSWESMQCWSSTGYCWCVDENGIEIEGTNTPSWQGFPDCANIEDVILGDINFDNIVNILDVIILVNHILSPNAMELEGADINNDGEINILDVITLVNIILN